MDTPQLSIRITCDDVEMHLAALVEGTLDLTSTAACMQHMKGCSGCRNMLHEFRRFVVTEAPRPAPAQVDVRTVERPQPPKSPLWEQWEARLNHWLDERFPATRPQLAFRGGPTALPEPNAWEHSARRQASDPLLFAQKGSTQLVLHVARGFVFGRVGGSLGEPRFPVLLTLKGGSPQEPVLNQPDGTFYLKWDPEATELECQSPTGSLTRFELPD